MIETNIETRNMTKFLWFPKTIQGKTKWLTAATWREERHKQKTINWFNPLLGGHNLSWSEWEPIKWL